MKLYLLPPNQEFTIDEMPDLLKVKSNDDVEYEIPNRFLFRKMDGAYGICLDNNETIHYLGASTEVTPFSYH